MINKAWYAERQFITNRTLKSTGGEGQIYKSSLKRLCDLVTLFYFTRKYEKKQTYQVTF